MRETDRGSFSPTPGLLRAAFKVPGSARQCEECGLGIPKYSGRYPSKCPRCSGAVVMAEEKDRRPHGSADGPPPKGSAAAKRQAARKRRKKVANECQRIAAGFKPQSPKLQALLDHAWPAAMTEDGSPEIHLVPYAAFDTDEILPLLEGPEQDIYYRIEQPDEPVMLFAFTEARLACWASDEPERWLGFDPREEIVQEDWEGTFEEAVSTGAAGRKFEDAFTQALTLLDLQYQSSGGWSATVWDIRPVGAGWHRLIADRDVNIKVATARHLWTAGGADLYHKIRNYVAAADNGTYTRADAEKRMHRAVKAMLKSTGAGVTAFLKPKTKDIQARIERAVRRKDKAALRNLLVNSNFATKRLGRSPNIEIVLDWDAEHAENLGGKLPGSWQSTLNIRIDGGVGSKFGVTGRIDYKGGIFTVAFRDRQKTPSAKHHAARTESVDDDEADEDIRADARRPRKPGQGLTRVYGGFRFHVGKNQERKPRKDVGRCIQNRLNARRGLGRRVKAAKDWHRSHKGAEMHRDLARYNRGNKRSKMRETIADVRERIARWTAEYQEKGYIGETQIGAYRHMGGGGYTSPPPSDQAKTLDDIFEGLLRRLIVVEALDVLQDVEFDDVSGALYLFFDPSLPGEEMDELIRALQGEQPQVALIASPDRSIPGETVDSMFWVAYLPGKGEDGQPSAPDSRVYAAEQEPGSKIQMVKQAPPTPVEQIAMDVDIGKLLKSMGGK